MKTLPRLIQQTKRYLKKESPVILSCIGAAGVVATTVLAVRATLKAVRLLDDADEEKWQDEQEDLTVVEKVKIAGPVYIPTMVAGAVTVGCIVGSNVLNRKQQVSLMSAYALAESSYKKYQGKVKELLGVETDTLVKNDISKDRYLDLDRPIQPSEGKLLWYEPYRDEFFEMTEKEVIDAEYHVNRSFILRGETNLNEFYEFLGLEPTDAGCEIGWEVNAEEYPFENTWIDFEHHLVVTDDGNEYYRIEIIPPSEVALVED